MNNLSKKIYRSKNERMIGGVAGGLGEYFNVDPLIFRIIFILFAFFDGGGLIAYVILWIIIPEGDSFITKQVDGTIQNAKELSEKAKYSDKNSEAQDSTNIQDNNRTAWGLLFITLGVLFFFKNFFSFNFFEIISFNTIWPVIIISLGVFIIFKKN